MGSIDSLKERTVFKWSIFRYYIDVPIGEGNVYKQTYINTMQNADALVGEGGGCTNTYRTVKSSYEQMWEYNSRGTGSSYVSVSFTGASNFKLNCL